MFFFCKQKTAYEMRISDWSSDVCSSDLRAVAALPPRAAHGRSDQGDRARNEEHRHDALFPVVQHRDRKSVVQGKSVSVRVDLGGRRIIKKKTYTIYNIYKYFTTPHNIHITEVT